jgi:hypothetical protein
MDPISDTIQESASRGGYAAIAALIVWASIAVIKRDDVPIPLPPRYRPLLALALGQVYAVLETVVGGMPWGAAVVRGLVVAAGAIAVHEVGSKVRAPAEAVKPPSVPPPMPPLLLLCLALAGCVPLLGCGSPLRALIVTTDAAAVAGEAARPILREACTEPAEALVRRLDAADRAGNVDAARAVRVEAAALAEHCDPAAAGLALLLRLHAAARAAIVAYHATGGPPPGLAGIVVSLAQASMDLGLAISKVGKGGAK